MQKTIKGILDKLLDTNNKTNETIELLRIVEKELVSIEYTKNLFINRPVNQVVVQTNEATAYRLLIAIAIKQLTEELDRNSSSINNLYDIYEDKYRPDLK